MNKTIHKLLAGKYLLMEDLPLEKQKDSCAEWGMWFREGKIKNWEKSFEKISIPQFHPSLFLRLDEISSPADKSKYLGQIMRVYLDHWVKPFIKKVLESEER